ncbi:hypothetical protein GCM10010156_39510 [Planobispora rosea]|uniref:Secreted protein n=1 Tax=Planobispora rosea TaxID=35762 RepID=A0A8J3S1Z4_PLARO|nr:hypothetical protein [Planobispora rosea]GGS76805.1 hypothetical protein GCM10010156_39510 [Planobispora rosea]GIH86167.1 hypothetical protein Pro02_45750 [Planobispora rosea]
MEDRVVVAAVLTGTLLASASAHAETGRAPWIGGLDGVGEVEISGDRENVTLCDHSTDDRRVAVQYRTTMGRVVVVQAGPGRGCVEDSVVVGSIERAKFCYGLGGADLGDPAASRWCDEPENI